MVGGAAVPEALIRAFAKLRDFRGDSALSTWLGSIAIGHPFGMTGARIMTTLLNDLEALDASIGLETMCVAGGQGESLGPGEEAPAAADVERLLMARIARQPVAGVP